MTQTATAPASVITPEIVADHGLSPEEYERVLAALGSIAAIKARAST